MNSVHSGIDSLHILVGVEGDAYPTAVARKYFERFGLAKQAALKSDRPEFFGFAALPGVPFRLLPHGKNVYGHVLTNPGVADIRIKNHEVWRGQSAKSSGQILIQFRNEFIVEHGINGCLNFAANLVDEFVECGRAKVWIGISRIDLCADIERATNFGAENLDHFVSRSRGLSLIQKQSTANQDQQENTLVSRSTCAEGEPDNQPSANVHAPSPAVPAPSLERTHWNRARRELETAYFGSGSAPIKAKIYNKRVQAKKCGKEHWEPIWAANGAQPDTHIWRVEFSLKGRALRQFPLSGGGNLQDAFKLIYNFDRLWNYLTKQWLAQIVKRSRGAGRPPVFTEFWQTVIDAFGDVMSADRRPIKQPEVKQLRKQAQGCFLTAIALLSRDNPREALISELEKVFNWLDSPDFEEKYRLRRLLLGRDHENFALNRLKEIYATA
ncbi:hypothetical protein [Synechococcus elongatus]|uniref:hypothetical protein n=1 Tax=Synechococcus elongatus TaxID=32046 RepID=UPI0030D33005